MDLLPVAPNPRGGRPPSWKISNDHISGMGYLTHFHELESSLRETYEKNNERGVIRLVTFYNIIVPLPGDATCRVPRETYATCEANRGI